jgi:small-conductance mechanosensitive channel
MGTNGAIMKSQSNKKGGQRCMVNDKYILGYRQDSEKKERDAQDIINELILQKAEEAKQEAEAAKQEILRLNELKDYLFKKDSEMNKLVKEIGELKEENQRINTSMKVQSEVIKARNRAGKTAAKQARRQKFIEWVNSELQSSRVLKGNRLNILYAVEQLHISEQTLRNLTTDLKTGVLPCNYKIVVDWARQKNCWVKINPDPQIR